jgi:hypothetical protein
MRQYETVVLRNPLFHPPMKRKELARLRRAELERLIAQHEQELTTLRHELRTMGGDAA